MFFSTDKFDIYSLIRNIHIYVYILLHIRIALHLCQFTYTYQFEIYIYIYGNIYMDSITTISQQNPENRINCLQWYKRVWSAFLRRLIVVVETHILTRLKSAEWGVWMNVGIIIISRRGRHAESIVYILFIFITYLNADYKVKCAFVLTDR